MWTCANCGEPLEPAFESCWNCGTAKQTGSPLTEADTPPVQVESVPFQPESVPPPPVRFNWRVLLIFVAACLVLGVFFAWYHSPTTAEDYFERATRHLNAEEHRAAISDLDQAFALAENAKEREAILTARALAHNNLREFQPALRDINAAIELHEQPFGVEKSLAQAGMPRLWDGSECYLIRANVLLELGEKGKASADLRKVLEYEPENKNALHLLAIAEGR